MIAHLNQLPKTQPIICSSTAGTIKENISRIDSVQRSKNQRRRLKEGWEDEEFQENAVKRKLSKELEQVRQLHVLTPRFQKLWHKLENNHLELLENDSSGELKIRCCKERLQ